MDFANWLSREEPAIIVLLKEKEAAAKTGHTTGFARGFSGMRFRSRANKIAVNQNE